MTRDEFEQQYADRSEVTVEALHAHGLRAFPCDCGYQDCEGWAMLPACTVAGCDRPGRTIRGIRWVCWQHRNRESN